MSFNISKRNNNVYKTLLILLIVTLSFTSCALNDPFYQNTSEGFERGFKFYPPNFPVEVPPSTSLPIHCACKSDKSEFNINFVILDFFYGGDFDEDLEEELKSYDYPYFDLCFSNDCGDSVVAKRVYHNLVSEKYRCNVYRNDYGFITEIKFNYSEKVWIPKKLFKKDSGVISICLYGENQSRNEKIYMNIIKIGLYYKVTGNKVVLSTDKIK